MLVAFCAVACSSDGRQAEVGPNVLVVVLDTTRADFLGPYSSRVTHTPNIDRVAEQGRVYSNCISTSPWTVPAHASMFTGLFPSQHRATWIDQRLRSELSVIAEDFRDAGYRTAAFISNPHISKANGYDRGFGTFEEIWRVGGADKGGRATVAEFAAWMRERPAGSFYAFVNIWEPHQPYNPPPQLLDQIQQRFGGSTERVDRVRELAAALLTIPVRIGTLELDATDREILRALYRAEVEYTDRLVGDLIGVLLAQGVLDETLLVLTGDHGEELGDEPRIDQYGHQLSISHTLLHVPLILRLPGQIPPGSRVEAPLSIVELRGLLRELTGLAPAGRAGDEGLPGAQNAPRNEPSAAGMIAEYYDYFRGEMGRDKLKQHPGLLDQLDHGDLFALYDGRYKVVIQPDGTVRLFDIVADPRESSDLAAQRPEVAERLATLLQERLESMGFDPDASSRADFQGLDPQTKERLKQLGYL